MDLLFLYVIMQVHIYRPLRQLKHGSTNKRNRGERVLSSVACGDWGVSHGSRPTTALQLILHALD